MGGLERGFENLESRSKVKKTAHDDLGQETKWEMSNDTG
jgi:hypothetical protein